MPDDLRRFGRRAMPSAGRIAFAWVAAALAISSCGLGGPAHQAPAANAAAVVDMGFESYSPAEVTVGSGETVQWRNTSFITHSVTADPRRAKKPDDARLPPDVAPFDSGDIAAGQVYTRSFTVPGTYRYFCTHHEDDGMIGTVVVRRVR
jgi:plastocyanin